MGQAHERPLKFDAAADVEMPALAGAVVETTVRAESVTLRATYWDTADRHLQRRGVRLRRLSGGPDAGWHLTLPLDDSRTEIRAERPSSAVPRELGDLVKGICLGQRLSAAARIDTVRTRHQILDRSGELVVEVVEDNVWAIPLIDDREPASWRELEVELGPAGDESTLKALGKLLKRAGFRPSGHGSKYVRAVGEPPGRERPSRLAGLVADYLCAQYGAIGEEDARLRLGENRVHKMRVAVRRTRSTLRVFGDIFDHDAATHLDAELRWIAETLGRARDLDVVRERLARRVDNTPERLLVGSVAADLDSALARERAAAGAALDAAMRGRRYLSLLKTIDRWRTQPPRTDRDPKASTVQRYVDRAGKKERTRLRAAITSGDADDFHRARKAAKRHRYAAELAQPRLGTQAAAVVEAAAQLQDDLGELQDTAASCMVLLDLARRLPAQPTASGFTYGLLYGDELHAADETRRRIAERNG
jgi:CHAD domain-containing protein